MSRASLNKVMLLGNLTRDPELRYTPSGTAVASFGLAVNNRTKQGDEWKDEACFVDIVTFGRQAELCSEYLGKGRQVLIEGRLNFRKWETPEGQSRSKLDVVASNVQFMSQRPEGGGGSPQGTADDAADDSSDVPF